MNRMFGIMVDIVLIFVLIIWFIVFNIPWEYTADSLVGAYDDISTDMGWDDSADVKGTMYSIGWLNIAGPIVGIFLVFIHMFALAHKKEYDVSG